MKNSMLKTLFFCLLPLMMLVACTSHESSADDAFERVKEEKLTSDVTDSVIPKEVLAPKSTKPIMGKLDDWGRFTAEADKKIRENETTIKELQSNPKANNKTLKKVLALENSNTDLRKQMEEYQAAAKVRLEEFKVKINADAQEIEDELLLLKK